MLQTLLPGLKNADPAIPDYTEVLRRGNRKLAGHKRAELNRKCALVCFEHGLRNMLAKLSSFRSTAGLAPARNQGNFCRG